MQISPELAAIVESLYPDHAKTVGVARLEKVLARLKTPDDLPSALAWLESLNEWLKTGGVIPELDLGADRSSRGRTARLAFFFDCLAQNSEWSESFQATVYLVCTETSARRLLTNTGLGGADSLTGQLVEHVLQKTLPEPPDDRNLGEILLRVFPSREDAIWFDDVEPSLNDAGDDPDFFEVYGCSASSRARHPFGGSSHLCGSHTGLGGVVDDGFLARLAWDSSDWIALRKRSPFARRSTSTLPGSPWCWLYFDDF